MVWRAHCKTVFIAVTRAEELAGFLARGTAWHRKAIEMSWSMKLAPVLLACA
jgi:hypothetical protein